MLTQDPRGARFDPALPHLERALSPSEMEDRLSSALASSTPGLALLSLDRAAVVRWKAGRRCLIEYDLSVRQQDGRCATMRVLGKMRGRGVDFASLAVHHALWNGAFGRDAADAIRVAQPVGVAADLDLVLHRWEPGVVATTCLRSSAPAVRADAARRAAATIRKLHGAGVVSTRVHRIGEEMRILRERLEVVTVRRPDLATRIRRMRNACDALASRLASPRALTLVHRDFYPDQLLVPGRGTVLLDLDLCCMGDPAMDAGNFTAHLTELGLRQHADPTRYAEEEAHFVERFLEDQTDVDRMRAATRAYAILTLARHVELSSRLPGRAHTTAGLLDLCEQGLAPSVRRALPRAVGGAPVARLLGWALALCATLSPVQAQSDGDRIAVELRQVGVFDSNIGRSAASSPAYGGIVGASLRFRDVGRRRRVQLGLEALVHRYTQTQVWDRTSAAVDAGLEQRLTRWLSASTAGLASYRGSNEDRELANQLSLEQSLGLRLPIGTELRGSGAFRLRRYDDSPDRNATNGVARVELRQRLGRSIRVDLGARAEWNRAAADAQTWRRSNVSVELNLTPGPHDELAFEVQRQHKAYTTRLVELDVRKGANLEGLRVDDMLQPQATWQHRFGAHLRARLAYEWDWRRSNDPGKRFHGHRVTFGVFQLL